MASSSNNNINTENSKGIQWVENGISNHYIHCHEYDEFKNIQEEWKKVGQVPPAQSQELWSNYKALVDIFYNNRSIFFELKELDRKKRLSNEEKDVPVSQDTESEERNKIVAKCIEQLGETCKKVLMYYYFEEMSMQDIADKLGFENNDTAKTKKYKCKKKLDELIKAQYSERDFLDY